MNLKKLATATVLSTGLLLGSMTAATADEAATTTSTENSKYTTDLAAYKMALMQYRIAAVTQQITYRASLEKYRTDWAAAVQNNLGAWKVELEKWQQLRAAWSAKVAPLTAALKLAVAKADADYLVAKASAITPEQQKAALAAHSAALTAARTAYKAAVTALGTAPVKPVKPVALVKPVKPAKPAAIAKPVAPTKPAGLAKAKKNKD